MPHIPGTGSTRASHGARVRATHDYDGAQVGLRGAGEVAQQEALDGVVLPGGLMPGTIASASFAASIRPIAIVAALPTLPDADYPPLSYAVLTTDSRLYKNIADVWVKGVDGADVVANSINAGQIAAGAISTTELAVGYAGGSLENSDGRVLIDDNGITIQDGALVIQDEFGSTVMQASGFTGPWTDFISLGLYNARFMQGTVGSLPLGRTVSLPYWTIADVVGTPPISLIANTGVRFLPTSANTSKSLVSDMVPVRPGIPYTVPLQAASAVNSGSFTIEALLSWYTDAGVFISEVSVGSTMYTGTTTAAAFEFEPIYSSSGARFASLKLVLSHSGSLFPGNSVTVLATGLREATAENLYTLNLGVNQLDAVVSVTAPNLAGYMQHGSVSVSVTASTSGSASVTFPVAFAGTPHIVVTSTQSGAAYAVSVTSPSSSGFTVNVRHIDATSTTTSFAVHWIAMFG